MEETNEAKRMQQAKQITREQERIREEKEEEMKVMVK